MNRIYMIEFLVNKVKGFSKNDEDNPKQLIITLKFGPKSEFVLKESDIDSNAKVTRETDKYTKQNMWVKHLKSGKSYIFPSYPDTLLRVLEKFRLEVSVWDEDITELNKKEFVGTGSCGWDTLFMKFVAESSDLKRKLEPIVQQEEILLKDVNRCSRVGYVDIVIRLTAMSTNLFSTFQRNEGDYVFQSNAFPSVYQGKTLKGEESDFHMIGPLYASISLQREIEKLESHNEGDDQSDETSNHSVNEEVHKIDKIRIADIKGPCGYVICPIAQKIKKFLRNIDDYVIPPPEVFKIICQCDKSASSLTIPSKLHLAKEKVLESWWDDDVGMNTKLKLNKKDGGTFPKKSVELNDLAVVSSQRCSISCVKESNRAEHCVCLHDECPKPCYDPKCECAEEETRNLTRMLHKPFCPAYIHKMTCPLMDNDGENAENLVKSDDDNRNKNTLADVPPISLGPCLVPGKPCRTNASTDGSEKSSKVAEARKDKTLTKTDVIKLPAEDAPKRISCSREFEQLKSFVKQALAEFKHNNRCSDGKMPYGKRCCDKDTQIGDNNRKVCCIGHKMGRK